MSDLFVRLAKFLNLKKEASSFAGRVVELVLQLLNENAPVAVWSKNFIEWPVCLCSTNHEELNCVESCIVAMVLNTELNDKLSEKFARALASLPSVRVSKDSWSIMIHRILISVNNLLNDAFVGLEEEKKGHEIMMLLVPPGTDPPPTLGHQLQPGSNVHVMKKFRRCTVHTISTLIHCCDVMLTNYYPVQVNVPVRALIALIQRVLLVSGTLHNKMFPSTTSLHQELICFELPTLHSIFLDLLIATINGMRSHLIPHAASTIRLMTEYFKVAKLPSMRAKVYSIAQSLLVLGLHFTCLRLVSNGIADLKEVNENDMTIFGTNSSKVTAKSASKRYSKKRKHDQQ